MTQASAEAFGNVRKIFWPIHRFELKKLLPLFFMMFCISFNYTILRDMKDAIVVGTSGAETIPFLKTWLVVPSAIIFMIAYAKLSNLLSKEALFYVTIAPFLAFFALYAFVLYPLRGYIHPQDVGGWVQSILPTGWTLPIGLKGFFNCFNHWTGSLFYILAELWGSVALSLLFWQFANQICRISEAKRFYTVFTLGANIALPFSGLMIRAMADIEDKVAVGVDAFAVSTKLTMTTLVLMGVIVMLLYRWVNKNVLTDPRFYDPNEIKGAKKSKPKMKLMESFSYLLSSKYLGCLVLLVIGYGMTINLVEVTWKSKLQELYTTKNQYLNFMGGFSACTGIATILMLTLGGWVIRRFGWTTSALVTPVVLLVTGCIFFVLILFGGSYAIMGLTPLAMAVFVGAFQNVFTKSSKYALFDPTKEMAYIPLDEESKVKGKAAIDVVGARLGKSGGSFIQQGLLISFGTLPAITPYLGGIIAVIVLAWILAAMSLGKQFGALTSQKASPAVEEKLGAASTTT